LSTLDIATVNSEEGIVPPVNNWLIYDGECPFCSRYVQLVRVRKTVGPLPLINARDGGPEFDEVIQNNLDLNEGMVLKLSGRLYHGQDCIHALALLSEPKGLFNRFNAWVFKSPRRAAILYPVLRAGRNLVLKLLGRKNIKPD
jgi:predicted DCC family thiol-disulfide oxidoreductase YuxK